MTDRKKRTGVSSPARREATIIEMELERSELSVDAAQAMTAAEMRGADGGRCHDAPLGERSGCPSKQNYTTGGIYQIIVTI